MGFSLHFFTPDAARALVAQYPAALAPGSYIVLSVGRGDSDAANQGFGAYSSGAVQVVDARERRPDLEQAVHLPPGDGQVIVGVARVG
jgi:hypothetical protein